MASGQVKKGRATRESVEPLRSHAKWGKVRVPSPGWRFPHMKTFAVVLVIFSGLMVSAQSEEQDEYASRCG